MKTWSRSRLTNAVALGLWAALFWFLIVDDRVPLYLSSRTAWLAYLGAALATTAAIGYALFARTTTAEPLTQGGLGALAVFLLPVVILLALPPTTLGSFAASRRTSIVGQGVVSSSADRIASGQISLVDIAGALASTAGTKALAARAGETVSFVGFVAREQGDAAGEFILTRFLITCCPGDALGVQVRVVGAPPGKLERDQWVRVTGQIYPLGAEVILDASRVERVARPSQPYLNP